MRATRPVPKVPPAPTTFSMMTGCPSDQHDAAWHYYGPASPRHPNPLEATVHVPTPGAAEGRAKFTAISCLPRHELYLPK
jgi:hypothetical protein